MTAISEAVQPPRSEIGVLGWVRKNLFSTWYNALLTLASLGFIYVVLRGLLTWALTTARWEVVTTNLTLFLIGPFPRQQVWRVWVCVLMVVLLGGLSMVAWGAPGRRHKWIRRWVTVGWLLSFPLTIMLLHGFASSSLLPLVGTSYWGGLLLTFLLAIVGIVASFPLGVLLALGRRSSRSYAGSASCTSS
jgi:general L-amino acid transport system permease protein